MPAGLQTVTDRAQELFYNEAECREILGMKTSERVWLHRAAEAALKGVSLQDLVQLIWQAAAKDFPVPDETAGETWEDLLRSILIFAIAEQLDKIPMLRRESDKRDRFVATT